MNRCFIFIHWNIMDQDVHSNTQPHMGTDATSVIFRHLIWIPTRKYIASSLAICQDDFAPQCFFRTISLWGFRMIFKHFFVFKLCPTKFSGNVALPKGFPKISNFGHGNVPILEKSWSKSKFLTSISTSVSNFEGQFWKPILASPHMSLGLWPCLNTRTAESVNWCKC